MGLARELARELTGIRKTKNRDRENRYWSNTKHLLESGQIKPEEVKLRELAESTFPEGRQFVDEWFNPARGGSSRVLEASTSAGIAVAASDFSKLTSQLVFSAFLERFNNPTFLWPELFPVQPTTFETEIIPGTGQFGDDTAEVGEGGAYPRVGFSEDYIDTPRTIKRGLIVSVTKEAVFHDQNGRILQGARDIGDTIGYSREKRCLDCLFGITNTYRRNGTAYNTFQSSTPWINIKASNALVDWTDVEAAELLFDAMVNPSTGEPITIIPDVLVVPSALKRTAQRIVNATLVNFGEDRGGNTTAANTTRTESPNPIGDMRLRVLSSPFVYQRTTSNTTWYIGQAKRGVVLRENWGPTIQQSPPNSFLDFNNDIVNEFKISAKDVPTVIEPRYWVKNTA